jgi:hypothetical protein
MIVNACKAGNISLLRWWGQQGVQVRTAKPLVQSVESGVSFDVLKCLVKDLGADVNQRDERGGTALMVAVLWGRVDSLRYIVEELRADVNLPDYLGHTPLRIAASKCNLDAVRCLLKLGADINQQCDQGITALMIAAHQKDEITVKWLVKAGSNTQILTHGGETAASISCLAGASAELTAYLDAKTHCLSPGCSGAGLLKCTGCRQARYCGETCQLVHWKAHKADCKRWSAELVAGKGNAS